MPSVSTIIGNIGWSRDILLRWQAREFRAGRDPDQAKNNACSIGNAVHSMIECWIFGQDDFEPDEGTTKDTLIEASEGLGEYIKWSEYNNVEYLESEIRLASEKYQYGGTADGIAIIDGETVLIDFKTSAAVRAEHIIQLSAYKNVIEETTDYKIDRCIIVRITKGELEEGEERIQPHYIPNDMIDLGWESFKIARDLHEKNKVFGKFLRAEKKKK